MDPAFTTILPFHVSKFFCHFAFAHAKEIDATQVPRLAGSRLPIDPADDTAILGRKHLFGFKQRVGRILKERFQKARTSAWP
jgi:hypothetical protein